MSKSLSELEHLFPRVPGKTLSTVIAPMLSSLHMGPGTTEIGLLLLGLVLETYLFSNAV